MMRVEAKNQFWDLSNTFGDWVESVKKIEVRYLGTHQTHH